LFYQEPLSSVKTLTMLSLLHNAVVSKPNYRLFVIHKFPNLRVLDFKKVKERVTIFD
jgi:U2 small nuclear ribonucleoprotein A'